jgi:NAD+ diphosphatase
MSDSYIPLITPPESVTEPALWFAFRKTEILVVNGADRPALPCCLDISEHGFAPVRNQYLGLYGGKHCYAVEIQESQPLPEGWAALGLRDLFGLVETTLAVLSGRAWQLLEWDRNYQYCSRCGTPTQLRTDERSRSCPSCGLTSYPPVSPAIMILVTHQGKMLLARKAAFPKGRYSALAGFVEPGETLEDTVIRETREEVGVEVKNIRYFGSQPWPFPHSLMVGFTAQYASGEIRIEPNELEDAKFFSPDEIPPVPPRLSIARRLIDAYGEKHGLDLDAR